MTKAKRIAVIVSIIIVLIVITTIGINVFATDPKGVSVIDIPDGYYESVQIDASAVYSKGRADGTAMGLSTARLGQQVTVNGEPFFILYETGYDNTTTLLAKYCLNTNGTAQSINGGYNTYKCAFSSANYWNSLWTSGSRLNLNGVNGNVAGDAMTKAQNYARTIGGKSASGRLLTCEEAGALQTNYSSMIFGTYNTASEENDLSYWLGSVLERTGYNDYVWGSIGGRKISWWLFLL